MYLKPSSFKTKSYILGIGNGFLSILLIASLKSEIKQTVPFFFGIINVGVAHSDKTPMNTNILTSILRVYLCTFGIGNGFTWYSCFCVALVCLKE